MYRREKRVREGSGPLGLHAVSGRKVSQGNVQSSRDKPHRYLPWALASCLMPPPAPPPCSKMTGTLVGIWLIYMGARLMHVDFACQFSHTKREHDYIERITNKQFVYDV